MEEAREKEVLCVDHSKLAREYTGSLLESINIAIKSNKLKMSTISQMNEYALGTYSQMELKITETTNAPIDAKKFEELNYLLQELSEIDTSVTELEHNLQFLVEYANLLEERANTFCSSKATLNIED